jgi:uncharacterized protein
MKSKLLAGAKERTFALIFDTGDEVASGILHFAQENHVTASHFTAIGAFKEVILGYFEIDKKQYKHLPVQEQVEVLSLLGDIALEKGEPKLHAHVVVGMFDGSTRGGHLIKAVVRPTLEVILTESPAHLRREFDEASGLALIRL